MKKQRYLSAKEATEILSISAATLYSYVSRGLIRSESVEGDSRVRRYHADDVYKLKEHKAQKKDPAKAAQTALYWGTPVLDSALTSITENAVYYRGYNALALARTHTFEQVAALLWLDNFEEADRLFIKPDSLADRTMALSPKLNGIVSELSAIQKLLVALTLASAEDFSAYDTSASQVAVTGARVLQLMTAVLTLGFSVNSANDAANQDTIAGTLTRYWGSGNEAHYERNRQLINAALILCADHELNVSSFAARVVASSEASPYAVVTAGLSAIQGSKHGGNTERVEALLHEIGEPQYSRRIITDRLRRGERIPGFGHHLYPDGDPRAVILLQLLWSSEINMEALAFADSVIAIVWETIEKAPNIDFALVVLARALGLPTGSPLALFALGRTVGWIGHAIEQYTNGTLIRPRAHYVGIPPRD